ncbi:MAG: SGNH/GDSL hydrolase family protein [Chroococcidiopsidaceae cyanobacterium CP_BM_ER_R8_30]|nr:SGNH/GDSL hydrolase family protein [Chroococcidiopsidaceae cyanobacterium CP_BM_ER_R8_30]
MSKISSLFQTTTLFLVTGLSVLSPTRIQAYTTSLELQKQPVGQVPLKLTLNSKGDLIAESVWQKQGEATQNKSYNACLFGDSISSSLGNSLGNHTFNFAMGGMTTTSLVSQLEALTAAHVRCQTAIIAMGTNDADSGITNDDFINNLKTSISLVQVLGASNVFVIPAFYSTVEASHNPALAGPIARVEEINALIRQVAAMEKAVLFEEEIQPLYQGQSLRKDLTIDGVHLNSDGQNLYRQALLKIINPPDKAGLTLGGAGAALKELRANF